MVEKVSVSFICSEGTLVKASAEIGMSLLEVAHANNIEVEGTCEGCMACATCHLIVHEDWNDKLPKPSEEELDMLDLVYGLTKNSRLGCQIKVTKNLNGLIVTLPLQTYNMME